MNNRVLLVEDDATLAMILTETLARDDFEVFTAVNGEEGLHKFAKTGADIIVTDVMMPRMDGFEMSRKIRQLNPNVPILFLTAKSGIDDIVEGFELGGNDYLTKPFKMLELIVRIKALLRRKINQGDTVFDIGDYRLDMTNQTLTYLDREPIKLSMIEAKLLEKFAMNIGLTVDAGSLMQLIWQRDDPFSRNSLHGFIHKLRNYLRHDKSLSLINQRGIGYLLAIYRR
ncbi:MAG: response regulator transcription factor [Duncaniella sp.]|nr:response regulator transcription factor [Duncaniella sp.]